MIRNFRTFATQRFAIPSKFLKLSKTIVWGGGENNRTHCLGDSLERKSGERANLLPADRQRTNSRRFFSNETTVRSQEENRKGRKGLWSGSRPFWSCVQRRRANNLEAEIGPGEDALRLAKTFAKSTLHSGHRQAQNFQHPRIDKAVRSQIAPFIPCVVLLAEIGFSFYLRKANYFPAR